jgi:hypothetical protein
MLILSDLFWSITQESDTTLYAEPIWSFLIHYTRSRHHAVCWSYLIFSDPLHGKPTPRCVLILSDLFWSITQEPDTTLYADPVWFFWSITQESDTTLCADPVWSFLIHSQESDTTLYADPIWTFLIHYTRIRHHAVCWSCLIFSDPLHKNPTPRCILILSDLFWSITQGSDTTLYADPVWSCLIQCAPSYLISLISISQHSPTYFLVLQVTLSSRFSSQTFVCTPLPCVLHTLTLTSLALIILVRSQTSTLCAVLQPPLPSLGALFLDILSNFCVL